MLTLTTPRGSSVAGFTFRRKGTVVKFRVERDVLADAVAWAARALPVRPSSPVLAGLLIEAGQLGADGGDGLQLSTFDYETSARATLNADVTEEGQALVSGRLLSDICRSLPSKAVDVSLDGPKVVITCGASRFTLPTMAVEDYPNCCLRFKAYLRSWTMRLKACANHPTAAAAACHWPPPPCSPPRWCHRCSPVS